MRTTLQNLLKSIILLFVMFLTNSTLYGQAFVKTYDFASVTTSSGLTDPTPVPTATGVTFGSFTSTVGTNSSAAGRFSYTGWPTGATNASDTFSGSLNTSSYYSVTITPVAGYSLDIDAITFTLQRSGTGIRQYSVRSSLDYTTNLPASISPANANLSVVGSNVFQVLDSQTGAVNGNTITLGSSYNALTSEVTFRFYGFNAEATGGTFSIDNVTISGTTSVISNNAPVATNVNFTGTLEVGQLLSGTYTYSDSDSDPELGTTFKWYRSDDALGANEIQVSTSQNYTLTGSDLNKFIRFGVTPIAQTGTTNGVEVKSDYQGPITSSSNSTSTITVNPLLTPTTNVDYSLYTGTDVTSTSYELARFLVNDIAGTPDDGLATTLTGITFSLTQFANIEKVALYDDTNTEIQEITASGTLNFSSLGITAASGSSKSFSVRVTFKTTVTDNARPILTITGTATNPAGSLFAAANAGGASSSTTGDDNRIEVTATHLVFINNAVSTVVNAVMTPAVIVKAEDANNNVDVDFIASVDMTSTGTLSGSSTNSVSAVSGTATFSNIIHSASGLGLQLTFASTGFTSINSSLFGVYNPIFANPITGINPNTANPYTTGQTLAPNILSAAMGRGDGIVGANATDRYNANTWNTAAFDATKYFYFTLTPNSGYEINYVNLVFTAQRSAAGPSNFVLRSSVDNYTADIPVPAIVGTTAVSTTVSLINPELQGLSTPVTFRLYGWGTGTGTFSINDFVFNGDVAVSSDPSISVLPTAVSGLDYFENSGPSTSKIIAVTGASLIPADDSLTATASSGFEVSTDNINFDTVATIDYVGDALNSVPLYVRLIEGMSIGSYTGTVTISGGDATDVVVNVQGVVRTPFGLPYNNTFRTQALFDDAIAQGLTISAAAFETTGGYVRISSGGFIETPTMDFTTLNDIVQVSFTAATFGGNTSQALTLSISTDGVAFTDLVTLAPPSSTFVTPLKFNIDPTLYNSSTVKLRITMTAGTNTTRFRDFYVYPATTWDGTEWTNGEPTTVTPAFIDGDYDGSESFTAHSLTVNSGNVDFAPSSTINLQDEIKVNGGTFYLQNNVNLLQANASAVNTGAISIERQVSIRRLDYVFWSSPVKNQLLQAFSDETLPERFYTLNEATNAFAAIDPTINNFVTGKGFMIRAPNTFTTALNTFYGTFTGEPHNGNYNVAATATSSGFNLLGNPYPSPINITAFKAANLSVGTLYFWTHTSQDPASSNYATYTNTGSAAVPGGVTPNGTIQIGQGFIAKVATAGNIFFNNGMRVNNHQNQFFRGVNQEIETEKSRIWINLTKEDKNYNQILVGYVDGATNAVDFDFDGKALDNPATGLYNLINGENYVIQGKGLPFNAADFVELGFKAAEAGNYTIALDHFDGVFSTGQNVFIKDNLTGITHNISESAYTFSSAAGTFNSRFQIVYQNVLSVKNPAFDANSVVLYQNNNALHINSGSTVISDVKIFDIRGRLVYEKRQINASTTSLTDLNAGHQVLLVHITSNENKTITKKVVY